ncbi:MAG TPA: sialidase family protein [Thermoleophilaceae bacterium]
MKFVPGVLAVACALLLASATSATAAPTQILPDEFNTTTGPGSQHQTVVEPDTFANGSTIVAVAQVGRFFDGGSSANGFSTSTDNGATWVHGILPGITTAAGGSYDRATDPSIAFDADHGVWLASSLALRNTSSGPTGAAVLTSRSTDGVNWSNPVTTALASRRQDFDKNWITCDNNASSSPFHGTCYTQFDDFGSGNALKMYYSRDGGLTWNASRVPRAGVIGGQPLVLPNGNVVVPLDNASETALGYTVSTNGGVKFGQAFVIDSISAATDPGGIRSGPLPSAEIGGGKIYVVWEDCRFRASCSTNDLVYTTSTNGTTWTPVQRIPIDGVGSTVDHFLPGVAVKSDGSTISVTYYFYTDVGCTPDCQLNVGHISSVNGGTSWSTPTTLNAAPMSLSWLPDTSQGRMVGDYISSSFAADGNAHPAFALASSPSGATFSQPLFSDSLTANGGGVTSADAVVFTGSTSHGSAPFKRR